MAQLKHLLLAHKDCPVTLQQKQLMGQMTQGAAYVTVSDGQIVAIHPVPPQPHTPLTQQLANLPAAAPSAGINNVISNIVVGSSNDGGGPSSVANAVSQEFTISTATPVVATTNAPSSLGNIINTASTVHTSNSAGEA